MFGEVQREFSFVGWAFQLVFSYFGPLFVLFLVAGTFQATDSPAWQIADYAVALLTGVALAMLGSSVAPTSVREGRWVWVIPGPIFLVFAGPSILLNPHTGVLWFYIDPGWDLGEAGWGVALLTLPTWGCCWYAATMHWVARRRQRRLHSS
jgi:hypothetical protein